MLGSFVGVFLKAWNGQRNPQELNGTPQSSTKLTVECPPNAASDHSPTVPRPPSPHPNIRANPGFPHSAHSIWPHQMRQITRYLNLRHLNAAASQSPVMRAEHASHAAMGSDRAARYVEISDSSVCIHPHRRRPMLSCRRTICMGWRRGSRGWRREWQGSEGRLMG